MPACGALRDANALVATTCDIVVAVKVAFNDLPRTVRERFVRLTQARGQDPNIVLHQSGGSGTGWNVSGIFFGAVFAGFVIKYLVERAQYLSPGADQGMYAALAATFFVIVVNVIGLIYRRIWKPPPYQEGTYVFPGALARTDGTDLFVVPILQMGRPTIVHTRRNGAYVGSRLELANGQFVFSFGSKDAAQNACDRVLYAHQVFTRAAAANDHATLAAMDPFYECASTNTWKVTEPTPTEPRAMITPPAAKWGRWIAALVAGAALSGALYVAFDLGFEDDRDASHKKSSPTSTTKKTKKASTIDDE